MGKTAGPFLYYKSEAEQNVLKDMLQFLRSQGPGKAQSFSYIEAKTSLLPNLSLWENLQLEIGSNSVKDYTSQLKPEYEALFRLLKKPETKAKEADYWETFIVSLLKGMTGQSRHLLIDINEKYLSALMIEQLKKILIAASLEKFIFLATANTSLWTDCAQTIIRRNSFEFVLEEVVSQSVLKYRVS
jgi:hypothetical protein